MIAAVKEVFLLYLFILTTISISATKTHSSSSFTSSAFINPASPSTNDIQNQQRRARTASSSTTSVHKREILPGTVIAGIAPTNGRDGILPPLYAKKKKKSSNEAKSNKIQVKLTKNVPGTGVIGEVIMVAPAFFENKLKRTQSAVRISDEEVADGNAKKNEKNRVEKNNAIDTKGKVEDIALSLSKKTGPDGRLFGSVTHKVILEELGKKLPKGSLGSKKVKITVIESEDGDDVGRDIKNTGAYKATIRLLEDVSAEFAIEVVAS